MKIVYGLSSISKLDKLFYNVSIAKYASRKLGVLIRYLKFLMVFYFIFASLSSNLVGLLTIHLLRLNNFLKFVL